MKDFDLIRTSNDSFKNIIILRTVEDMYYYIDEIYEEVVKYEDVRNTVLVDLLLRNGISFNRFVLLEFENKIKYKTSVINYENISNSIKKQIKEYFKNNKEILNESALDSATIEKFLK